MNREIKFRAWLKKENKMIEVKEIIFYPEKQIAYDVEYRNGKSLPFHYLNYKLFEEIELMPYIGIEDKNGVEIYEGDIVATTFNNFKYKVIWDSESSSYGLQNITFNWDILELTSHKLHAIEVIGNIYENPELLGGKNE